MDETALQELAKRVSALDPETHRKLFRELAVNYQEKETAATIPEDRTFWFAMRKICGEVAACARVACIVRI